MKSREKTIQILLKNNADIKIKSYGKTAFDMLKDIDNNMLKRINKYILKEGIEVYN